MIQGLIESKKAKAAVGLDCGLLGLILGGILDPIVGAICITVITCVYLIGQAIVDAFGKKK